MYNSIASWPQSFFYICFSFLCACACARYARNSPPHCLRWIACTNMQQHAVLPSVSLSPPGTCEPPVTRYLTSVETHTILKMVNTTWTSQISYLADHHNTTADAGSFHSHLTIAGGLHLVSRNRSRCSYCWCRIIPENDVCVTQFDFSSPSSIYRPRKLAQIEPL